MVVANKGTNVDVTLYLNKGDKSIKERVFEQPKVVRSGFCNSDFEVPFSSVQLYRKNVQFCG